MCDIHKCNVTMTILEKHCFAESLIITKKKVKFSLKYERNKLFIDNTFFFF